MEYMFMPLKRYADFQGRSRRMEFWMFFLFVFIVETILLFPLMGSVMSAIASGQSNGGEAMTAMFSGIGGIFAIILMLFGLAIFIPMLAVYVRRFHDQDKSGWFVLLGLIPYLGALVLLVFMFLPGTNGSNRFGEDPKS